jgi:hypothetical protein
MIDKTQIIPASKVEMYQVHGNHIEAIMETKSFLMDYIRTVIEKSTKAQGARTEVIMNDSKPFETQAASLCYGEEDFGFSVIIATDKEQKTNQVVSFFPYFCSKKIRVRVETIWVWDNLLEATIKCSFGEFEFSFFATDYFAHKDAYMPGNEIDIRIGAMGMHIEEGEHGFDFEGQKAIDWLAKLGEQPTYDENGQVKPIHFNTEQLVAFLPGDDKCPDEASFQSPAGEIRERSFMDREFYETEIIIHRDEDEVSIPFIFRKEFVPEAVKGTPIRGALWIVGAF